MKIASHTEKLIEAKTFLEESEQTFTELHQKLKDDYKELIQNRRRHEVVITKDVDLENYLLESAQWKYTAVNQWGAARALRLQVEMSLSAGYDSLYELSEQGSKDRGFSKPTEAIREAFINSQEEYRRLNLLKEEVSIIADQFEKLTWAFKSDEDNYRSLLNLKAMLKVS